MTAAFLQDLRAAVQQYMDVWLEYEEVDPTLAMRERACLPARLHACVPKAFLPACCLPACLPCGKCVLFEASLRPVFLL